MSDFVEFPEKDYIDAGNVFEPFDGATSDFTLENALAMMWFAQLAYEVDDTGGDANAAKIAKIEGLWEFRSITPFRERAASLGKTFNTTGLVGERGDAIVLAFAGTDPGVWETVVTDGRFQLGPENTHTGFQAAFRAAAPLDAQGKMLGPVGEAIAKSKSTGLPLFVTGHSLGVAIGIIAADAMATKGTPPRAVYGFGTPCPGGAAFRQRYNAALGGVTYRLVHGRDVVARAPMLPGYVHVGRLLQTKQDTKFDEGRLTGLSEDPKFFAPEYLQEIASFLLGGGIFGFFKGLVMSQPKTPQEFAQAVIARLPPRGHGPLAEWFRALPPFIREHLEDQYIKALTPGAARTRSDV
jgi:triacylglycerol lipase